MCMLKLSSILFLTNQQELLVKVEGIFFPIAKLPCKVERERKTFSIFVDHQQNGVRAHVTINQHIDFPCMAFFCIALKQSQLMDSQVRCRHHLSMYIRFQEAQFQFLFQRETCTIPPPHAISLDGIFGLPRGLANETSGASFRGWRDRHPLLSFPCGEPKAPAAPLLKKVAKRPTSEKNIVHSRPSYRVISIKQAFLKLTSSSCRKPDYFIGSSIGFMSQKYPKIFWNKFQIVSKVGLSQTFL